MTAVPLSADITAEERAEWGELIEYERYWRDRQPWLQEHGYMLRPRYRPGWEPPGVIAFREDTHWSLVCSVSIVHLNTSHTDPRAGPNYPGRQTYEGWVVRHIEENRDRRASV